MELETLRKVIATVLGVDPYEIEMDTTFLGDLGADSLDIYQIAMGVEKELNITISWDKVEKVTTVREAIALIKASE